MICETANAAIVTPGEYVASQPKPEFKPGHTLPLLTYSGNGTEEYDIIAELAENWGYGVEGFVCTQYGLSQMATPGTKSYQLVQLVNSDPTKYKAVVHSIKQFNIFAYLPADYTTPDPVTGGFFSKAYFLTNSSGEYLGGDSADSDITLINEQVSPHAPDEDWQKVADCQKAMFDLVEAHVPISVIVNDGEWGIEFYGNNWRDLHKDVRFQASMTDLGVTIQEGVYNTDPKIYYFLSQAKSHELSFQAQSFAVNFPDALYLYYRNDVEKFRLSGSIEGVTYTEWTSGSGFDSRNIATNFAYPTCESYYRHANSGTTNEHDAYGARSNAGFNSQLQQYTNWKGFQIAQGWPLSYDFVCGGWIRAYLTDAGLDEFLDTGRYMGLLKCFYTMGMIGGNEGYYPGATELETINDPFDPSNPPHWVTQKMALGRVHALFSWLENYLRQGTLLPGPYLHVLSKDQPSYDFVDGRGSFLESRPGSTNHAHVFVRKMDSTDDWLLTAWHADSNVAENVTVTIPTLGEVTLTAAATGNVYRATVATGPRLVNNRGEVAGRSRSTTTRAGTLRGR